MTEHRQLIAILRGIKPEEIEAACDALIRAGITMIEVPLNSPDVMKSIGKAAKAFGHVARIGAGTVTRPDEVDEVKSVGGTYIVSPDCQEAVIRRTRELGMDSFPGVFTPSEAFRAIHAGATGLKFFPAEILGPAGIRAIKAVLPPDMPVYAVGGAGPENFAQFFAAGCVGFGLGSNIYKPGHAPDDILEKAKAVVAAFDRERPQ